MDVEAQVVSHSKTHDVSAAMIACASSNSRQQTFMREIRLAKATMLCHSAQQDDNQDRSEFVNGPRSQSNVNPN
jgi:hypothetical protein